MTGSTPPLLMLAEGRKPRPRCTPMARPKEIVLHFTVAKILRAHARPDWQWSHVANGELRDKRTAAKLKAMGVQRGWPDFVLIPPVGQLHCLELKRVGETLTDEQDTFRLWCVRFGLPFVIAYRLDDVLTAFDAWGCLQIGAGMLRRKGGTA